MKPVTALQAAPTIIVTGAAGFLGRRVVARLAAAGQQVLAVDLRKAPDDLPPAVKYRRVDLGAGFDWLPELAGAGFVLVHLAWNMNRADADGQVASVRDFIRLLEGLPARNLHSVVGLGSAEEYGELEGQLREDMAPGNRLSAYGKAKHEACRSLAAWARQGGRQAVWLRPFVIYGPGQGGDMAVPYALRCARERRPAEFSEGLQLRDFIHADDVAVGIVQAVAGLPNQAGTFAACNLGRGEPVRLRDVLERIARNTGAQKLFNYGVRPLRANEPQTQFADLVSTESLLGWRARISWKEGIDALCGGGIE